MRKKVVISFLLVINFLLLYPNSIPYIGLAIAPTQSEETSIEPTVLEQLDAQEKVPVLVTLETLPENLTRIERIFASDVPLEHISQNQYAAEISEQELQDLLTDPNVIAIDKDELFTLLLTTSVPLINASIVHARQNSIQNLTGYGQSVCVIDSGVNTTHPGISGNIIAQKCFCDVSDLGGGGCCADTTNEDTMATDDHGHGTYIAGIIAANGTSALGVAPRAGIVAVKVTNASGVALFSDITEAVSWCTSNASVYNISVISMSLGGGSYTSACDSDYASLSAEIQTAFNANVTIVVATGNSGSTTAITAPACINKTIAVSSTTTADAVSSFSNRNSITDVMAPGSSIVSLSKNGGTESRSGTSISAPHVAGLITLLQQYKEDVEGRSLTVTEINDTITTNGTLIDDTSGSGRTFIRIDAFRAVTAIDKRTPLIDNINTMATRIFLYNNITFIANVSDVNRETIWIEGNWSGTTQNYTLVNKVSDQYNFTITNTSFSVGTFQWRVHANDSAGNVNISNWLNLSILWGMPEVTIHNPRDNTNTNNASMIFNYTVIDDTDATACTLYVNNIGNQSKNTPNATVTEFALNLSEGTHSWYISCTDSNQLTENSSIRNFVIDRAAPTFNGEGYGSTIELGSNQSYSINVTETFLEYVNFSHLSVNRSMSNSSTNFSTTVITTDSGANTFAVYARDTAGNLNSTSGTFTVSDTIAGPRIIEIKQRSSVAQSGQQDVTAWILDALPISLAYLNANGNNVSMTNNTAYNFTYSFTVNSCGAQSFKIFASNADNYGITNTSSYSATNCCGDNICSSTETCNSCSEDCGTCSSSGGGGGSSGGGSSGGGSGGGGGSGDSSTYTTSNREERTETTQETIVTEKAAETIPQEEPILEDVTGKEVAQAPKIERPIWKVIIYSTLVVCALTGLMIFLVREKKE